MKRALVAPLALLVALPSCGGGDEGPTRIGSDTLTIYSSVPLHGPSAAAGRAVIAGQQRALRERRSRAGGRRVRLVRLSSTEPGDSVWDPAIVEANAERARDDPSAIAYLGELDYGGSAVSLPVTNRADLLQVSPADGLTSLTRTPPGRPRAGPERYYPERSRTFLRLVPSDLVVAEALLRLLERRRVRSVAVLHGEGIADRELTAVLVNRLRRRGREPQFVESLPDDEEDAPELVERLAASRAQAVVYLASGERASRATFAAMARRTPSLPVLGGAALAAPRALGRAGPRRVEALTPILPAAAQPAPARRLLRSMRRGGGVALPPEALYGYESMLLTLAAIDRGGPDRREVARAALTPRSPSVLGRVAFGPGREVVPSRLALVRLRGGGSGFELVRP